MTFHASNPPRGLVVSDLDGTLLDAQRMIGERDLEILRALGEAGFIRAIATGRSLYSARRVLDPSLPVDYLLFSSGAGIMNWPAQRLLRSWSLTAAEVQRIVGVFEAESANYMIHAPVPDNHRFVYRENREEDTDFRRRCEIYDGYCAPLSGLPATFGAASQVIAILRPDLERFERIRGRLSGVTVIRTTSPLDGRNLWMEIFPREVSKSAGSAWLVRRFGIAGQRTFALGNDYNDLDLLGWAAHSAVVANAPAELRERFAVTASHCEQPLSAAVATWGLLEDDG